MDEFRKIIGVYTPLQAKILESVGCKNIWVSGFGIAHDRFGLPDLDIISYQEKVESQKTIINSTSANSVVDIDNGLFNMAAFQRYIAQLDEAKPYGICIEDEHHPKISALYKQSSGLLNPEEFIAFLSIIRKNSDSKIYARTNTLTRNEPAKERYLKIDALYDFGVDALVVHTKNLLELKSFCDKYALKFNLYVITSLLDELKVQDYINMGVNGVILGHHLFFQTLNSQLKFAKSIVGSDVVPAINKESRLKLNNLINEEKWL